MSAPTPDERKPLNSWSEAERRKAVSDHFERNSYDTDGYRRN